MKLSKLLLRKIVLEEMSQVRRTHRPSLNSLIFEADEKPAESGKDPKDVLKDFDVSKGATATVAFLKGPGKDPRVQALLDAGLEDGNSEDEEAKITDASPTIGELLPTQKEIELTKSIGYPLARFDTMKKMISGGVQRIGPAGNDSIVTSGNLIVDGHHRWSSLFSVAGPGGQIAATNIELPEKDAASVLSIVQTAIAVTSGGNVPAAKAGKSNILGAGKDEIAKLIRSAYESGSGEAGPILTDDYISNCLADAAVSKHFGIDKIRKSYGISTFAEDEERYKKEKGTQAESLIREKAEGGSKNRKAIVAAREAIIQKVADNLSQMNQPAPGSPAREDMPQLDDAGKGKQGVFDALSSGEVNYKAPFSEASIKRNRIVVERWQRLAGIIKG